MAVKTYSLKKDGDIKLSSNFTVREFRCRDGSDKILIDEKLVTLLQKLRDKFGKINISSAYRNTTYNKKVRGAKYSQHLYGRAADITLGDNNSAVNLRAVAKYAEEIGFTGIGLDDKYQMFVHVDTRSSKSFFKYNKDGSSYSVATFGGSKTYPTLRLGSKDSEYVKILQETLNKKGFKGKNGQNLQVDGDFGANTDFAVRALQKSKNLQVDGVVGKNTWKVLNA